MMQYSACGGLAHLNTNYRHFYLFVTEVRIASSWRPLSLHNSRCVGNLLQFNLVDQKDMAPLDEFNKAIDQEYK
jgi:hypothetical protein